MKKLEESSRRVMAAYRGEKADRIPICTPISWDPMRDIDKEKPGGWRSRPDFIRVARLVQQHCDATPPHNAVSRPAVSSKGSYQRFLEAPNEYIEERPSEKLNAVRTRHTMILHTPKGDLTWAYDEDEGIDTNWDMIKPVNSLEDVDRLLSVPYRFDKPDPAQFEPFRRHRKEMGQHALCGAGVNSMVAMLVGIMDYEQVLEWILTEPGVIKTLADTWLQRTWERVEFLLDQGVGPFWLFNGVERASPPMMGPKQWAELVEPYDGTIMKRIKERDPASIIHVHCHGKVGTLLESFIRMGADSTDPVEPPPQGDIEFVDAKRLADGRLTLYGNMEFVDMERCRPDEIEEKVRRAIEDGGKAHMVLFPSAVPHEQHTPQMLANAERYIQAGLKYGRL
jgi:hypothetical protein